MRRFPLLALLVVVSPLLAGAKKESPPPVVQTGIDVLVGRNFDILKGKQIGLITNHTGVDAKGKSIADLLIETPGVKLVALFSPEHGIRGNLGHGQVVGNDVDPKTHLPVYSLYGETKKPTQEMLNAVDTLVFDMQDVGARFYTYLTTMAMAIEAAEKRNIGFVVLDRPNPLGGTVIEGQPLDSSIRHFTAYFGVPTRHGMTPGEIARWFVQAEKLQVKLDVVSMNGWKRDYLWTDTGLPFIPPSPNIRTPVAELLYVGVGMFETTNVAVGRGTDEPFERFGAPWVNGAELAHRLQALNMPGMSFFQTLFVPTADLYQGRLCSGVRIVVTDPRAARPVDLFVHAAIILRDLSAKDFELRWDEVVRVTGTRDFEKMYKSGKSAEEILKTFREDADRFKKEREPFLLYP